MEKFGPVILLVVFLAACGGSSSTDEFSAAAASANAKEAEARSLGSDSPCDRVEQCGVLTFAVTAPACGNYVYKPYSLVAANSAAASAAAGQQRDLAQQANRLAPSSGSACPALINPPPALACTVGRCTAAL